MRIDTSRPLTNLKGENLKADNKDFTLGEALANILVADDTAGKMKAYVLARKFVEDKSVDLDPADTAIVKAAVERTKLYTALVSGQVLVMLEDSQK